MNIKQAKRVAAMLLCLLVLDVLSQSAICSYSYRKRIAFDPTKVSGSSDLVNYTALISITSDNDLKTVANSGHVQSASGYDIYFTSDDGVTKLDFQLEKYTATTGELVMWVRIPVLSATRTTNIYMYYGNPAVTTDQSSTATWNPTYKSVWHLHNNSFSDGTASANTGTNSGSTNLASAKIAGGRSFSGSGGNYIQLPLSGGNGGSGNSSLSFWGLMGSAVASRYFFGESTSQNASYTDRVQIYVGDASGNLYIGLGNNHSIATNVQLLSANTWYHIALTWATTGSGVGNYTVFVNGISKATGSYSAFSNLYTTGDLGNDGNAGQRSEELTGSIDEVHLTNTVLTSAWVLTEYNNQSSPSTFYSVSSEPKVWLGTNSSNANSAVNWLNNASPGTGDDVIITNGTNQPALQSDMQLNSIYVRPSATLSLALQNLSLRSDVTNCGVISSGSSGTLTMNSTSVPVQYVSGSGTYTLGNFQVNNTYSSSPSVVLNKDVNVAAGLVLTSGVVSTGSTNILALGTGATSTSGSSASYVSGPISKAGSSNFVFPTGKGGLWRRAAVSNLSGTATFRAEYFNTPYTNSTSVNAPLNKVSKVEYWQIDRLTGTGNANVSLYWENAGGSGINDCTDLTIARFNGSSWDERAGTSVAGSNCSGSGTGTVTTNAAVTAFSPFTFGSKTSSVNPLPVELTEFTSACSGASVILSWTTASEKNNAAFILEKSTDGAVWSKIAQVAGAGNSQHRNSYSHNDTAPVYAETYYRLSQVDMGGQAKVYRIIAQSCVSGGDHVSLYPNPAGEELNIEFTLSKRYSDNEIRIIDPLGRICFRQSIAMPEGQSLVKLKHDLPAGSYSLLFASPLPVFATQKLLIIR